MTNTNTNTAGLSGLQIASFLWVANLGGGDDGVVEVDGKEYRLGVIGKRGADLALSVGLDAIEVCAIHDDGEYVTVVDDIEQANGFATYIRYGADADGHCEREFIRDYDSALEAITEAAGMANAIHTPMKICPVTIEAKSRDEGRATH